MKCANSEVRLTSRLMDDPLEAIGDWVDALTEQYGHDALLPQSQDEHSPVNDSCIPQPQNPASLPLFLARSLPS